MTIQELALQGKHNIYNSMAAGVAGKLVEIRKDTIRESLSDFHNIDHRLEVVGNVHVGNNVVIAANSDVFLLEETMLSFDNQFALNYIKKKILK